eukprot:8141461-Ditylum_brightwellii.AAC.1
MAEALSQLYAATEEDRSIMLNLMTTNLQLTERVANLTTKLSTKDKEINALQRSLEELTATICTFSMASMMQQSNMMPQANMMPNMNMFSPNVQSNQSFIPNAFLPQQQQSTPNNRFGNYQRGGGGRNRNRGRNGGRGRGQNTGRQQQLYYSRTCGANRYHAGTNCQHSVQGHIPNATFANMQGGSTRGLHM